MDHFEKDFSGSGGTTSGFREHPAIKDNGFTLGAMLEQKTLGNELPVGAAHVILTMDDIERIAVMLKAHVEVTDAEI